MQRNEKKENDQRQKWIGKRARREKERQHTGERERERDTTDYAKNSWIVRGEKKK